MPKILSSKQIWQHWAFIEEKIDQEMDWLRSGVQSFLNNKMESFTGGVDLYFLRKIALLIIAGEIMAKEIIRTPPLKSFWIQNQRGLVNGLGKKNHGKQWHAETMDIIESHFLCPGFNVIREPNLYQGRADLGVYLCKKDLPRLYIEIGTTSIFKLWRNLMETPGPYVYLIVPGDDKLIEFRRDQKIPIIHRRRRFGTDVDSKSQ